MINYLPKHASGCPKLFLAPMEGLGSLPFRKAMTTIGGFDEACTEFLRVPCNGFVTGLAKKYHAHQLTPYPQAVQLMGSSKELMAEISPLLEARGAPRIDLNCGCPSNTVTGRGAGSSLLKEPRLLYEIARAMVKSVRIPVTAKLRLGFTDTSLFKENLLAAQEAGVAFITLHPRTKVDGYSPPAKWEFIAEAKSLLKIPVVGNGDILTVHDALRMLQNTHCDALMIGRGAAINPWIFHEIKAHFSQSNLHKRWDQLRIFLDMFVDTLSIEHKEDRFSEKNMVNHLKQLMNFLFKNNTYLLSKKQQVLKQQFATAEALKQEMLSILSVCSF
jgi:tRNA-dihydrouridine synthase C